MHKTNWTRLLAPRLNALRFSPARQAEIIEELSQHLDDRVEELTRSGAPPADAEQAAISEITDDRRPSRCRSTLAGEPAERVEAFQIPAPHLFAGPELSHSAALLGP